MEKWRYLQEFEARLNEIYSEMIPFLKSKQALYGPRSITDLGIRGLFCRIWDKTHRFKSLVWDSQEAPPDETLVDTAKDQIGYWTYVLVLATGRWPDPDALGPFDGWRWNDAPQLDESKLDEPRADAG